MHYTLLTSDLKRSARKALATYVANATGEPQKAYALHIALTGRHIICDIPLDTLVKISNSISNEEISELATTPGDDESDGDGDNVSEVECEEKENEHTSEADREF